MKFFVLLVLIAAAGPAIAQVQKDVLATAAGMTFRLTDLSPEIQKDVADLPKRIPQARTSLLEQLVNRRAFEAEAASRGISLGKLLADEKAKIKDPSEAEIKKVLDENADRLAGVSAESARKQVIAFLRSRSEQQAMTALFEQLKTKFRVTPGKDVNTPALAATDVVATVNGKPITAADFEAFVKIPLYEARAELAEAILEELDQAIYIALINAEAKALGIDSSALIAREVSNKMKDFTDAERIALNGAFADALYAKYKVNVQYAEPEPPLEKISADDDPARGPAAAPVTVIMFTDLQCPSCAAVHPLLNKVIEEFPGKVRLVVRDVPLESIHENAFLAARAAYAANVQGKFFEYIDILYRNQSALDAASLRKYAVQTGLDAAKFDADFNSEKSAAEVRADAADAEMNNINSTPTIFINGRRLRHFSVEAFRQAIRTALRK